MNADEFKKQFPKLSYIVDKPFNKIFEQNKIRLFTMEDVNWNCLSKQRVKEAIRKFRLKFNRKDFQKQEAYNYIEEFERELGCEK